MMNDNVSKETLPLGFEGSTHANTLRSNSSQTPLIKWKSPPKYMVNGSWKVAAGDESKETQVQNLRGMKFLEPIHSKTFDIPSNPVLIITDDSCHNDHSCPLIPVNPIEEDNVANDMPNKLVVSMNLQPQPTTSTTSSSSIDHKMSMAAQVVLSSFIRSNTRDNRIDRGLLFKNLTNPTTIEQLVNNQVRATASTQLVQPSYFQMTVPPLPLPPPLLQTSAMQGIGSFYPTPRGVNESVQVGSSPPPLVVAPVSKDINYYKSLIQQHGGESQYPVIPQPPPDYDSSNYHLGVLNNVKARKLKQKIIKPCIYFNTSRGCRNGSKCTFKHDTSNHHKVNNSQHAKRMKTDWRITGI